MKRIVLVGAGQLGSRHLQGLSQCRFPMEIEVVDPSASSLELARSRFEEMPGNANVRSVDYAASLLQKNRKIDLAIVATYADVRAEVIRALVENHEVNFLVLEKVLFQRPDEYRPMQNLLKERNVKTWVNHPRRMFPYYRKLRQLLGRSDQVSYQVQGGDWGLGCNGLHMIDHLAFLTGEQGLTVDASRLNGRILRSKRRGIVEFSGALSGTLGPHLFELFCHDFPSPMTISICSDTIRIILDEVDGWSRMATKECGWQWVEEREKITYFQSELSNRFAEDIVEHGECELPTMAQSIDLHLPFIEALMGNLDLHGAVTHGACPIT